MYFVPGSSVAVSFLVTQTEAWPFEPFGIAFSAAPEPPVIVALLRM